MAIKEKFRSERRRRLGVQLAIRIPLEVLEQIDAIASASEYPVTRSDIARRLICHALKVSADGRSGVRAAV